jgi:hypothetical protein
MTTFAKHVDDYLRLRRGLGFMLEEHARLLPKFAAHLDGRAADRRNALAHVGRGPRRERIRGYQAERDRLRASAA